MFAFPRCRKSKEKLIKIGSQRLRSWSALSKLIFKGFSWILGVILAPKMEPKSKKKGIKNKSDFKTKLEGRPAPI